VHELSIATALVDQAQEVSREYGGAAVTAVRVRVGELSGVVADALRFSFDVARAGTAADRALLVVQDVPARARCEPCDDVFAVGTPPFLWCPRCDTAARGLVSGRELEITAVELADTATEGTAVPDADVPRTAGDDRARRNEGAA
jgi:hydrogenase nickel incorporation protein HypA/HybF